MQSSIGASLKACPSSLSFCRSHIFFSCSSFIYSRLGCPYVSFSSPTPLDNTLRLHAMAELGTKHTKAELGVTQKWVSRTKVMSRRGISSLTGILRGNAVVANAHRGLLAELESIREESNTAGPLDFEPPLQILVYPDPRLRAKNKRINVFDDKLRKLAEEMFDVMYKTDGVGLSAPQVGVNVQLMVYNPQGERGKGEEIVLVNPKIIKYSKKRNVFMEGCLSFPLIEADVERPVSVRIEAQDMVGKKFFINLKEYQARIFQHEYDHLQGTLFFERMTPQVLDTILLSLQNLEEGYEKRTGLPAPERIKTGSDDRIRKINAP